MQFLVTKNFWVRLLLTLTLGVYAGCANYHLGTGAAAPTFHTLYVAPVLNHAKLPEAVAQYTEHLRTEFITDGRLTVASSSSAADAVLTVTLVNYSRDTLTVQTNDTGLARKMGLILEATATLVDQRTGKVLFTDRKLRVERQIFTDSGQLEAEYNAVPLLAEQLAKQSVAAVLDVW